MAEAGVWFQGLALAGIGILMVILVLGTLILCIYGLRWWFPSTENDESDSESKNKDLKSPDPDDMDSKPPEAVLAAVATHHRRRIATRDYEVQTQRLDSRWFPQGGDDC